LSLPCRRQVGPGCHRRLSPTGLKSHGAILLRIKSPCEQIICLILCNTFLHWTIFKERSQGAILRIKTLANKRFVNYLVRFASSEHRGLLACLKTPLILHHGVVFQATRRALTSIRTWSGEPDIDTGHLPRFGQRHRLRTDQQDPRATTWRAPPPPV
jgi:hypothetical protein